MSLTRLVPSVLIVSLLLLGSFVSITQAAETCGETTCNDGAVCCNAFVGTGPQCVSGTTCPAGSHPVNPSTANPTPTSQQPTTAAPSQAPASSPSPASTQTASQSAEGGSSAGRLDNPLKADSITELLAMVLQALVQIGSIFLILALVYVGFLFVAAQGSEEKIRDARGALLWTVIGGLILLGAQSIALVIQATVNAL